MAECASSEMGFFRQNLREVQNAIKFEQIKNLLLGIIVWFWLNIYNMGLRRQKIKGCGNVNLDLLQVSSFLGNSSCP
jgi:hypothetical protein